LGDSLEPFWSKAMTRALDNVGFPRLRRDRAAFAFRLRDLRRATWRHAALRASCMSFGCAALGIHICYIGGSREGCVSVRLNAHRGTARIGIWDREARLVPAQAVLQSDG
jgi:hypothetical protein